jgi:hypothetical protein
LQAWLWQWLCCPQHMPLWPFHTSFGMISSHGLK